VFHVLICRGLELCGGEAHRIPPVATGLVPSLTIIFMVHFSLMTNVTGDAYLKILHI